MPLGAFPVAPVDGFPAKGCGVAAWMVESRPSKAVLRSNFNSTDCRLLINLFLCFLFA